MRQCGPGGRKLDRLPADGRFRIVLEIVLHRLGRKRDRVNAAGDVHQRHRSKRARAQRPPIELRRLGLRSHYDDRQRQRFAGRNAGADFAHENPRRAEVLLRRHRVGRQVFAQQLGQLLAGSGEQDRHGLLLPIGYVAHLAGIADRGQQMPMQFGESGHQFLADRQGQLAREFLLVLWILFGFDHLHRGVEPAPNAPDFSDRAEAAEVVTPVFIAFEVAGSFDQRPQGLDIIDEGEPLSHLIPGTKVGMGASGARDPLGLARQVAVQSVASQVRSDLMLKGTEEIASREIGDLIIKYLKNVDRIAYIRFASVYKQFEEPEDFRRLLLEVKKKMKFVLKRDSKLEPFDQERITVAIWKAR